MRCENWESSPCERVIRIDATASIRVRVRPFWVVMQKTETTVLHNPGTLPVLTFPGFYRLSERGFMTAASHRGPELDRSRKKKLIPMYRAAAKKYRPLIGRHSLVTCEDGLVIDILWEKRNFEHLCGVWCDRPPQVVHAGRTIEANYFFDQLIKGRLPSSAIHYSDYPRTRGKAEVLSNALDLEGNVDVVVDSDKAEVVYYLGGEAWCLGLDSDWNGNRMRSGLCNGNVFYPKSIRRQSVYKRMRTDSIPHRVSAVELVSP